MNNRIDQLSAKYWAATITELETEELKALLSSTEPLSAEHETLRIMLGAFQTMRGEFEQTEPIKLGRRAKIVRLVATFAASAAAIVGVGLFVLAPSAPEPEIYCYINGEPITDIEVAMEQTKYFEQLAALSQTINKFELILN